MAVSIVCRAIIIVAAVIVVVVVIFIFLYFILFLIIFALYFIVRRGTITLSEACAAYGLKQQGRLPTTRRHGA